jgi:hypothetical protein
MVRLSQRLHSPQTRMETSVFARLLFIALAAASLSCAATTSPSGAGAGTLGGTSGGGDSIVPIDISPLTIDISEHSGAPNLAVPYSKSIPGSNIVEQSLYPAATINAQLDNIFGLLSGIPLDGSESGANTAGQSFTLNPTTTAPATFSAQEITGVDCTQTCSGSVTTAPACIKVTMNNQQFYHAIFTALPDANGAEGAGCFRMVVNNTTSSDIGTILNGTESLLIGGVWDHSDASAPKTELFWNTTTENTSSIAVRGAHALFTETGKSTATSNLAAKAATQNLTTVSLTSYQDDASTSKPINVDAIFERTKSAILSEHQVFNEKSGSSCRNGNSTATGCPTASVSLAQRPADMHIRDVGFNGADTAPLFDSFTDQEFNDIASADVFRTWMKRVIGEKIDAADTYDSSHTAETNGTALHIYNPKNASIVAGSFDRMRAITYAAEVGTEYAIAADITSNPTTDGETLYFFLMDEHNIDPNSPPAHYGVEWGTPSLEYQRFYVPSTTDFSLNQAGTTQFSGTRLCMCIRVAGARFAVSASENCNGTWTPIDNTEVTMSSGEFAGKATVAIGTLPTVFNTYDVQVNYVRFTTDSATCPAMD